MAKNTKPAIRFKGFTDDWEQRKVGELSSSFEYGLNVAAKEYDGENKYIRITDIDDDSREFKQEDITSPDIDLSSAENYRLSEGDILFARTGASVGKSYIYKASDGLVYYAGFLIRARIKPEYNSGFVFQNTLTGDYEKFIKVTSMRSGQPGVNAQEYSQYQIIVPSKPEQDKISDCLRNLDHLITLHQRKYDSLVNVKKAMLEKMFPKNSESVPEIRFKGFTDAWEQRKLGEIAPLRGGYAFQSNNFLEEGIPIVKISNILSTGEVAGEFSFYEELDNDTNFILPDKAAVLAMSGATTGKVSILSNPSNIKFYQNQRVGYFKKTDGINYPFISTLVRSQVFNNQLNSILVTGAQPNVSSKDIDDFDVLIPASYKEQKKIGAYFSNLDHLITLHQRKLEKLKNIKKSCLEKMFV